VRCLKVRGSIDERSGNKPSGNGFGYRILNGIVFEIRRRPRPRRMFIPFERHDVRNVAWAKACGRFPFARSYHEQPGLQVLVQLQNPLGKGSRLLSFAVQ
jgi:hypothetical protein